MLMGKESFAIVNCDYSCKKAIWIHYMPYQVFLSIFGIFILIFLRWILFIIIDIIWNLFLSSLCFLFLSLAIFPSGSSLSQYSSIFSLSLSPYLHFYFFFSSTLWLFHLLLLYLALPIHFLSCVFFLVWVAISLAQASIIWQHLNDQLNHTQ